MKASDLKFKSSKKSIATISKKGLVRIKKAGRVTITVTTKNKKRKTLIRISSAKKPKPRLTGSSEGGFYLNKDRVRLISDRQDSFQFHVYEPDGMEIPSYNIKWRSEYPFIADISRNGTVQAGKSVGTTYIYAEVQSLKSVTKVTLSALVRVYY